MSTIRSGTHALVVLAMLLHSKRAGTAEKNAHLKAETSELKRSNVAFGKEAFSAFRTVREAMELPSWINQVPRGFGTTEHGKLSADQWHTACTVVIPVALIWLWGCHQPRKWEMLSNFMDLVTAVVFAGLWRISPAHITVFEEHMLRYLHTFKKLFKEASIVPNHHLSLHLPAFMRLFGPVHAWRSFAFERYNYMLQSINSNLTFGSSS